MWAVYILLFFIIYVLYCLQAKRLLSYYSNKFWPFHLNLWRWNQDVKIESRSMD